VATAYPTFREYCMADQECADSGFITFLYAEQACQPTICKLKQSGGGNYYAP
jgi:hypothetical protein